MIIGIDASRYGHETATGVERYSFYIINGLIEKASYGGAHGHKLVLYSREPIKLPEHLKYDPNVVKFKVIPCKRFWTQIGLAREMHKSPPDKLFVPSHTLPFICPKDSIITIHDVAFKHLRKSYSLMQYAYLDVSTRFAVSKASKIIVPSECTRKDLIYFYKCPADKISVIHHGYENLPDLCMTKDQEEEVLKQFWLTKEDKFMLFIGRLETKKNVSNLVKAFSVFVKDHKDWKLFLGGKRGIGFNKILKTVDHLKIWDNVIMPGYVRDVEKYVLFKYCKMFVFPSLYEGFGFPLLEAFADKKPVLTSNVSSIPEIAGNAVYYTDPCNHDVMAKDMEKLALDENLQKELTTNGVKQLEKFRWDVAITKTWNILTD